MLTILAFLAFASAALNTPAVIHTDLNTLIVTARLYFAVHTTFASVSPAVDYGHATISGHSRYFSFHIIYSVLARRAGV